MPNDPTKFQTQFNNILTTYKQEFTEHTDAANSFRTFVDSSFTFISAAAAGTTTISPPVALITIIAATSANKYINSEFTKFENEAKQLAKNAVKIKLSKLDTNIKPEEWVNKNFKAELDKVPDEVLPSVNKYLIEAVQNQIFEINERQKSDINQLQKSDKTLTSKTIENRDSIAALKISDLQLQSNIEILSKGIQVQKAYSFKLNTSLGKVKESQKQLIIDLNNFKDITTDKIEQNSIDIDKNRVDISQNRVAIIQNRSNITENRTDINSMAKYILINKTPKEQWKELKKPIFANTVTKQEKAAIKVQAQRQQVLEDIQSFAGDVGSIAMIANNIGLPSEITQVLNNPSCYQ